MKLSLPIIAERLNLPIISDLPDEASNELRLPRPVFHTNEKTLKSDTLYICKGNSLPSKIKVEEGSALICIGYPEKTSADRPLEDIIILDDNVDIFKLSNEVNTIYDFFDAWETSLNQFQIQMDFSSALKYFIDVSDHVFANGLSIMDSNNIVLAQSAAISKNSPTGNASFPALTKEIFRGDSLLYSIVLSACLRPFKKGDSALLSFFADKVERFSKMAAGPVSTDNVNLARMFIETIETGSMNKQALDSEIKKSSLSDANTYRLVYLYPNMQDVLISTITYHCRDLAQEIDGVFSFVYQDTIIAIVSETPSSHDEIIRKLTYYVRENNFKAGISNPFSSLYEIKKYYRQAKVAFDIGIIEKPSELIHSFSNYTLDYVFNKMSEEFSPDELYSPIYYRLEEYDKANKTEYLETLRVYLKNNQNAVQTAKDLFIHRATIIYRLKRICEIGQTELTDEKELLHLYMTFHMKN